MRKPYRFFSLNRPKLRQSWNKHNLYNLSRQVGKEPPIRGTPTFFQQKWAAKSKTRAYHGEHIPEKKWIRLFSRRLLSAVDMPPQYLAANDGSEQATGRGSGLSTSSLTAESFSNIAPPSTERGPVRNPPRHIPNTLLEEQFSGMTPYMQMTFAPMERRLDTAVFRALFATSVRQARQFIIHGSVKVNGKKMVHPSYQLNPGDMFQVDPEKVLYATGEQKIVNENKRFIENLEARKKKSEAAQSRFVASKSTAQKQNTTSSEGEASSSAEANEDGTAESEGPGIETLTPKESWQLNNRTIKFLLKDVKKILKIHPRELTAKQKKQLRLFRADAKRFISHPEGSEISAKELISNLQFQMMNHEVMRESFDKLAISVSEQETAEASQLATKSKKVEEQDDASESVMQGRQREIEKGLKGLADPEKERALRIMGESQMTAEELRQLSWMIQFDDENPVDNSKPYATPWRPRPFMAAFTFIPRYLEVNQNICAAVYIRHPVARKGLAEVPTPFNYITSQLAHNWYLQRG